MRDVKSELYFEQMKGRGVRTIEADEPARGDARRRRQDPLRADRRGRRDGKPEDHVAAAGAQPGCTFDKLIDEIAAGRRDETLRTLAGRLAALDPPHRRQGPRGDREGLGWRRLSGLASRLLDAIDPDALVEAGAEGCAGARAEESARGARRTMPPRIFDDPALRRLLKDVKAAADIRIDTISTDAVVSSGWDEKKAHRHGRALQALSGGAARRARRAANLYRLPYARRRLTYEAVEDLKEALKRPPWLLEPVDIWRAYKRLASDKVRGNRRER